MRNLYGNKTVILCLFFCLFSFYSRAEVEYNHPELEWQTFETAHFIIHFTPQTERSAREGAFVAEKIYPHVTRVYNYEPPTKTHIIFTDTEDFSNGAAYFYENKIEIWASPLDFELRGSHRWLQNVITHEFGHIVSIQKSLKFGRRIPGLFFQLLSYEKEVREDVLHGYPDVLVSYNVPSTLVSPWLAEGIAQNMYSGATYDLWDSHRDMILRDKVLNGKFMSFAEINTFGKSGIGNEAVYNIGYAFVRYIVFKYGESGLVRIVEELSRPWQYSIDRSIERALGIPATRLYEEFLSTLRSRYQQLTSPIKNEERKGKVLISEGTTNIHPVWSPEGKRFAYLSNKDHDFFSQTDLYVYDFEKGKSEKIAEGVSSAPCWNSNGDRIYFTKKSKPDRRGSRWFDIYEYGFQKEKEKRITKGARAFSPALLPGDTLMAYLAVKDGTHNIFVVNLNSGKTVQLTQFADGKQLFNIAYDFPKQWLIVDFVENHFRNIAYLSLSDSTIGTFLSTEEWDERDLTVYPGGGYLYSSDKSGVFNLYYLSAPRQTQPNLTEHGQGGQSEEGQASFVGEIGRQGYITNVLGGAFMPDANKEGRILYSLYENGGYKIALLDTLSLLEEEIVGYSPDYFSRFLDLGSPLTTHDSSVAYSYQDNFSPMFVFPRLMGDYGTIKPGIYFFSSEILNKLNVLGGASVNTAKDLDLFLLFEFRKFYSTLFSEIFYLRRNLSEQTKWRKYSFKEEINFRLFQWDFGTKIPILGSSEAKFYGSYQNFQENLKVRGEGTFGKLGFDYYIGKHLGLGWEQVQIERTSDQEINPSKGFTFYSDFRYENNKLIKDFTVDTVYATPQEVYDNYNFLRFFGEGKVHGVIPYTQRWTTTFELQGGWMSETQVDSFFNFFAGGLPGLKGYPYYGIEGNRFLIGSLYFRIPLFRERHIPIGPLIFQHAVAGLVGQYGGAWDARKNRINPKRSVGFQFRLGGFSFYSYPVGIAVEVHKGLDKFSVGGSDYDGDVRTYFTFLFGF